MKRCNMLLLSKVVALLHEGSPLAVGVTEFCQTDMATPFWNRARCWTFLLLGPLLAGAVPLLLMKYAGHACWVCGRSHS